MANTAQSRDAGQAYIGFLGRYGYLTPEAAAALDKDLMDSGFQLSQLMELAGLSVAQAGM
jgi:hypothetical protein